MSLVAQVSTLAHSVPHAATAVAQATSPPPNAPSPPGIPAKKGTPTEVITWTASVMLVCGLIGLLASAWKTAASRRAQAAGTDGSTWQVPRVLLGASIAAVAVALIWISMGR